MEIGVCGGPREWQMLARYRYDYCEGVLAWLASLDEDGFADAKRARNRNLHAKGLRHLAAPVCDRPDFETAIRSAYPATDIFREL